MVKLSFAVLSRVLAEYIPAWRLISPATKFSTGFCLCVVTSRLIQDLAQGLTVDFVHGKTKVYAVMTAESGFMLHVSQSAPQLSPLLTIVMSPGYAAHGTVQIIRHFSLTTIWT